MSISLSWGYGMLASAGGLHVPGILPATRADVDTPGLRKLPNGAGLGTTRPQPGTMITDCA